VRGVGVDWAAFDRPYGRRKVALPTYPFQRERYWFTPKAKDPVRRRPSVHPLLGERLRSPVLHGTVFENDVGVDSPRYLTDHRIYDSPLFPGAGFLEMGIAAARQVFGEGAHTLEGVTVEDALVLPEAGTCTVQVVVTAEEDGLAKFEVFSQADGNADTWRRHASGRIRRGARDASPAEPEPLDGVRARCTDEIAVDRYYETLAEVGVSYGPTFRGLASIRRRDGEALAMIEVPQGIGASAKEYLLHPALLDACIQLIGAALPGAGEAAEGGEGSVYVPVEMGSYRLYRPHAGSFACRVVIVEGRASAPVLRGDLELYDPDGRLFAEVRGVRLQRVNRELIGRLVRRAAPRKLEDWLYRLDWQAVSAPAGAASVQQGTWLVVGDRGGVADALVERLERSGHAAIVIRPDEGGYDPERLEAALDVACSVPGLPFRGAIHLAGLDAAPVPTVSSLNADHEHVCGSALALVQALAAADLRGVRTLFVTRGAQAVTGGERQIAVAQAPLWGLVHTVQLEHGDLGAVCLDLDPQGPADAVDAVLAELGADDGEDHVAWRDGTRYVARLASYVAPTGGLEVPADRPFEVTVRERGVLDNLVVRAVGRPKPGPGEVEIEVRAAGMNFRDVLNVLGMYPGDPGPIGNECAGVISAVGEGVTEFAVGDEVMAIGATGYRSYAIAPVRLVYRKPAGLSFAEAATIPVAFLTAWYGLHELARIREGDRVLIHAAAGGVGIAAVQIALRAGAEVFGTAGSPEKRAFLKSIGVHHTLNSRTLDFADEIMELTGGRGVDIVLNSLADDFIPRSLGVLADGGRFLEIGKRGVWTAEQVAAFNPTIEYHLYDLGLEMIADAGLARRLFDQVVPQVESGALRPLPLRIFPVRRVVDAFRYMAHAKHIGKIVVVFDRVGTGVPVREDGTYLITGGLGGIGLVVARWLVDQGARHLVLMGRREPGPEAQAVIADLERAGARVEVFQGDVGEADDVARLMARIRETMPPLRGVMHAAGVIDDGMLVHQTWPRFEKVARPKIAGAWNLHMATRAVPLDFFVLFSTGSAVLGSAGQGNYSAANAFLDAVAHQRSVEGQPALSINWGGWAGVGMVTTLSDHDRQRWEEMGVGLIEPNEGVQIIERLLRDGATQVAALPFEWERYFMQPGVADRPILQALREQKKAVSARAAGRTGSGDEAGSNFLETLEAADPSRRYQILLDHVRSRVLKVLGLNPSTTVDPLQPLTEVGMDSLVAVELSNHLQGSLGRKLPPTLAFEYPTIRALTDYLAKEVLGLAPGGHRQGGEVVSAGGAAASEAGTPAGEA